MIVFLSYEPFTSLFFHTNDFAFPLDIYGGEACNSEQCNKKSDEGSISAVCIDNPIIWGQTALRSTGCKEIPKTVCFCPKKTFFECEFLKILLNYPVLLQPVETSDNHSFATLSLLTLFLLNSCKRYLNFYPNG